MAHAAITSWTLHGDRGSGSLIAEALLEAAGQKVRLVDHALATNAQRAPDYLALNPMGQLPALVTPEGELLTESAAILVYLADRFPEARLAPPPGHAERGRFLRWVVTLAANIYPCVSRWDYPERFTTDPAGAQGVKQAAREEADRHWDMVARELAPDPWCLSTFSALDVQVAVMSRWMGGPERRQARLPGLHAHAARVLARPGMAAAFRRHYEGA
jgi:glutathione S-transferase